MINLFKSISAVTLGILVIPFFVHAGTTQTDQLCTALRSLVSNFPSPSAALVSSVEGMCPVATPRVAPSQKVVCIHARALTIGLSETMTHAQVKNLQIFLNNSGSPVSDSGDGSSGHETTYFGTKTTLAVQNWQTRNGVVTSGTPLTTGYGSVGAQTRAKMVQVACGGEATNTQTGKTDTTTTSNAALTRACTNDQAQTYGSGCRICVATGELASSVAGQECTAPVLTFQYYPSTQGLYWGVVRPQGSTCTAGGSWSGTKENTGEYILSKDSGTYTLTCTKTGTKTITVGSQTGVVTAHDGGNTASEVIDDVTEINPTNTLTPVVKNANAVITLKANDSTEPFSVSRGTSLYFTWSSNVSVTDCQLGSAFRSGSAFTQKTGTSGTIPTEIAQYTLTGKSLQEFDYTMSCKYMQASGYSTTVKDSLKIKVSPITTMPTPIEPVTY
ncbi:MAG: peptidoglycan-binding domain-containing protein [Minisyncoccia bacterium]